VPAIAGGPAAHRRPIKIVTCPQVHRNLGRCAERLGKRRSGKAVSTPDFRRSALIPFRAATEIAPGDLDGYNFDHNRVPCGEYGLVPIKAFTIQSELFSET